MQWEGPHQMGEQQHPIHGFHSHCSNFMVKLENRIYIDGLHLGLGGP